MAGRWTLALALLGFLGGAAASAQEKAAPAPATITKAPEVWPPMTQAPCGGCCDSEPNSWARVDLLYWWAKGARVPPLVTASPEGTPVAEAGVLGATGTTVLFGDDSIARDGRWGFRLAGGAWLDDCRSLGVDVSIFRLRDDNGTFTAVSDGQAILARPIFDVLDERSSSELVAFPGLLRGGVGVVGKSEVYGGDILARACLLRECGLEVSFLLGYRMLRLEESLGIFESLEIQERIVPEGTRILVSDNFSTRNTFQGVDLGIVSESNHGKLSLQLRAKVALGVNCQRLAISGGTAVLVPDVDPIANAGGLLALGSNIGDSDRNKFAWLPEIGINASYALTDCVRVSAGYTFLYLSEVLRPGDQIDLGVNPSLLAPPIGDVGPARPARLWKSNDFWLQGLNLGLEVRF